MFGPGQCEAPNDLLLSATGSEPDWGPADAPAAAYTPPRPRPDADDTGSDHAGERDDRAPEGDREGAAQGPGRQGHGPRRGQGDARRHVKGRKVASGKATAKKAGTVTVKLSKVRKSLARQDPHPQVDLQ